MYVISIGSVSTGMCCEHRCFNHYDLIASTVIMLLSQINLCCCFIQNTRSHMQVETTEILLHVHHMYM